MKKQTSKLADLERRFSPKEAAIRAGRSYRTITRHIAENNLTARRRKGSRLIEILETDLVAWMKGDPHKGKRRASSGRGA